MRDFSLKKLYYSISEVSKITEVEQYVLRYWETEFEQLDPQKNRSGNRAYTNKDIQLILYIKSLLREKKYTIEGAKKVLSEMSPLSLVSFRENKEIPKEITKTEKSVPLITKERAAGVDVNTLKEDLLEIKSILAELMKLL